MNTHNFDELQKKIQIVFQNVQLLKNVFIHRSYLNEHKHLKLASNEKLEFLGDSVLSLITSSYLYRHFPNLEEGDYTEIKAAIVRTESLASAARELGIGNYLYLSKGQDKEKGRTNTNILADTFEALIGGVFLDQGFDVAYRFTEIYLFRDKLDGIIKNRLYLSPKSRLQEYSQAKFKSIPQYKLVGQQGPEHKRTFKVTVIVDKETIATALGQSKKQAEETAAKIALERLL